MNYQFFKFTSFLLVFLSVFLSKISAEVLGEYTINNDAPSVITLTLDTLIEEEIYEEVDHPPRYPGCEEIKDVEERKSCAQNKMLNYIYKNLTYPKVARENGIQGTVITKFVVTKEGGIKNVEIMREIGGGCGTAVKNIIETMRNWVPGVHNDKYVNVSFTLPVKFKLENDKGK